MNSNINRALIFQGGASLGAYEAGAYEAGAYQAINKDTSEYLRAESFRTERRD